MWWGEGSVRKRKGGGVQGRGLETGIYYVTSKIVLIMEILCEKEEYKRDGLLCWVTYKNKTKNKQTKSIRRQKQIIGIVNV